ncbi:hypothetical protein GGR39_003133 [Novosphingobium fluoreni]|uniref:HNH endonuclease n=1 Tax=Novosphingobium fluoreni TaxID=1391222 RepID=A0A7W6C8D1_9SPHN|nr:hypothetical protein [Novosphingobium fluoreni]MBB3941456.1 hypothetical protein [Novosphingobium fluoreni]
MKLDEIDLDSYNRIQLPSLGKCIYCYDDENKRTEEHIIPYAIGENTVSILDARCDNCQIIINKYEQGFLSKQIGPFRGAIGAPSRTRKKKKRLQEHHTHMRFTFTEIDWTGKYIRDLGYRLIPFTQAPLVLPLWTSPPPTILGLPVRAGSEMGESWLYQEKDKLAALAKDVGTEKGAFIVKTQTGVVSREHTLRFLAKTAHAWAAAQFGLDAFDPFLTDIVLNKAHDMERYIGNAPPYMYENMPELGKLVEGEGHIFRIVGGRETIGDMSDCLFTLIQLYPMVNSPVHLIVVGKVKPGFDMDARMLERHGVEALA